MAAEGGEAAGAPIPRDFIDSHAHLHDRAFDADRAAVLARSRAAGVAAIVTVGTDRVESERAVALARAEPDVYAAVGFHPHNAKDWNVHARAHIARLARFERVVAIGEIGLDFYRDLSPRGAQRRAFTQQLALANDLRLPVVVHSREAGEETYAMLASWRPALAAPVGVLHCFSGDAALALRYLDLGFYVSFAGPVTYPKNAALREAARALPAERMVVETDCPYLSPQVSTDSSDRRGRSLRGRRNEPGYVGLTGSFLAELRGEAPATFAGMTSAAAHRLFRLPAQATIGG